MTLKSIFAILVIAAAPLCALAQNPPPAKVTKAAAQKVFKLSAVTRQKTQTFCDIGKLAEQMEQANAKYDSMKVEELSLKADELGKNWVPNMPR